MMQTTDYFASQAYAEGNRAVRLQEKVYALEDALEDAEYELKEWKAMYIRDAVQRRDKRT